MDHFVDFKYWCPKCEHADKEAVDDPCNDCLGYYVNDDSRKPVMWKEKEQCTGKKSSTTTASSARNGA